jgi:hypothetical protein
MMMPNCPNCGRNDSVRRSHRIALEAVLSLIFLYPFRCEHCDARFYRFHKAEAGSTDHLKAKHH